MKVYDLFSGLGGFSQAFVDRGHNVTRFEYDRKFAKVPHTIIKDVWDLTANDLRNADIILASPPCTHFSVAAVSRHWPKGEPTEATLQQIALVKHTLEIIEVANPKYWILENPRGMLRNVIGKPAITTYWAAWYSMKDPTVKEYGVWPKKPTDLWGRLPPIDWKLPMIWQKAPRGSKLWVQGINAANFARNPFSYIMPRSPALRAIIPYDFSLAVCLAVEGNSPQQTLV